MNETSSGARGRGVPAAHGGDASWVRNGGAPFVPDGDAGDAAGRLLALLRERRGLEPRMLERAERVAASTGEPVVEVLLKLGLAAEGDVAEALAELHGLPLVRADAFPDLPLFDGRVADRFLHEHALLPIGEDDAGRVIVACVDPSRDFALEALALALGREVTPVVALASELEAALGRLHALTGADGMADDEDGEGLPDAAEGESGDSLALDIERLRDLASEAPVIRFVNRMIAQAVELRASDIHLEPGEYGLRVRFRIDGVLQDQEGPPARLATAVISRIKIMARLDIAERRLPQDGRIKVAIRGTPIDLRVATLPGLHGEGVVMRLLDREQVALDFAALGIEGATLERFLSVLQRPNGIFLVTGPTGSGKTTTLYAALSRINEESRKIITVEDPVEYQLDGVSQTAVRPDIGLTFATALRAILRHDPDIVLVGEIRDLETAEIAAQAALTGHLVLSTLHTNDAPSSLTRLLDMGLEDYLVTATLNGVAAQRLVRRLCPACRRPGRVDRGLLVRLGVAGVDAWLDGATVFVPQGCRECHGTGYRGRTAILEILAMTDRIRRLLIERAELSALREAAVADGMRTLLHDGLAKVRAGITSLDEVLRVARGRADVSAGSVGGTEDGDG